MDDGKTKELEVDKQVLRTLIKSSIANSARRKYESSFSRWRSHTTIAHSMPILPASSEDVALVYAHLVKSRYESICASRRVQSNCLHGFIHLGNFRQRLVQNVV